MRPFLAVALLVAGVTAAQAHPHVWVTAREEAIFDSQGRLTAIRGHWLFDDMYSAFATEGLGKGGAPPTREELAPLAKTNAESLAEFDYFTHARTGHDQVAFAPPQDYYLEARADKRVVFNFTLPLKEPLKIGRAFSFAVYDATYFVDFELDATDAIKLVDAPAGCSTSVLGANPLVQADAKKLSESYFSGLSPGDDFGIKLASRIVIACP